MTGDTVTVFMDKDGDWRWRRQAANNEIISTSGEGFTRHADAWRAADRANDDDVTIVSASTE